MHFVLRLKMAWRTLATVACVATSSAALAGRPLVVDDAGTNAKGEGHVETWVARADGATTLNIAPAYAVAEGLELSAALSRDMTNKLTVGGVGLKWLITPSKDDGCNFGATIAAAHASGNGASTNATALNGIASCNGTALGKLHLNLGAVKPSGASTLKTWGLALEHEFGAVTPHIEWFGAEGSKPAMQIGARTDIAKGIQLDGTLGRSGGATLYSVGMKFRF
jgi:hypothetical protein